MEMRPPPSGARLPHEPGSRQYLMIWLLPSDSKRNDIADNQPASTDMRAYIEDIARHDGQTVTILGWLVNRRSSGKIHFLQLRDGSGFIQAVMSKATVGDAAFEA